MLPDSAIPTRVRTSPSGGAGSGAPEKAPSGGEGVGGGVQLWTPTGYVSSFDEYRNQQDHTNKKTTVYPANVPSINQTTYGSILQKCGLVYGSNQKPTNDDCGLIFRKIQCSKEPLHHQEFRHVHCNDSGCPICYSKMTGRMADRITERSQGYRTVYKERRYHLIFWPPQREGRPYAGLNAAFADAKRLLHDMGAESAIVEYHPYRIKKELKPVLRRYKIMLGLNGKVGFWKLAHDDVLNLGGLERYIESGPHFHGIVTGYLMNWGDYSRAFNGAGYKKKRYLDTEEDVHQVAYYISTHACREAGRSSVRYYGKISYRMLAREMVKTEIKDILCPQCKARLQEFDCDDTGATLQMVKDKITEKVKYYLYWKKGQPKPTLATSSQLLITRFCRD